jgi:hypothetical protein
VARGELERADDKGLLLEGLANAVLPQFVVVARFKNDSRQKELFVKLLGPLLSKVRGSYDKNATLALGPFLSEYESRFNRLPKATSSARMAPFERGDLNAKSAASTW